MIRGIEQRRSAEESPGEGHRSSLAEYGGELWQSAEVSASAAKLRVTGSAHESAGKGQRAQAQPKGERRQNPE